MPGALPIDPETLGAFALAATALVMSPGPDTILILRYAMGSGRRIGLAAVLGVQMGLLVHTALAIAGISLIIASSPLLFRGVAVLGAAYLAWLGIQGLIGGGAMRIDGDGASVAAHRALLDAMLCNLFNPKVIILFLALFPNFVDPAKGAVGAQLAVLAASLIVINTTWQTPLALAADILRRWFANPAVGAAVSRITGIVLIGFAVLMIRDNLLS